jgi:glutathione S-transferase
MKLYFSPGSCSLSAHIALHESDLAFETILTPTSTHRLPDGSDYYAINPLGYVPLLELDSGVRIREGVVILQYIADQVPDKTLAPPNGTLERYKLQDWLTFISTDVHKNFSPLLIGSTPVDIRGRAIRVLQSRLQWIDSELRDNQFLLGEHFTVADIYLFSITYWCLFVDLQISDYRHLMTWRARVGRRPSVRAAMRAEGLISHRTLHVRRMHSNAFAAEPSRSIQSYALQP